MATRKLYRVTADYGTYEKIKHFQTRRAALAHAAKCLSGYTSGTSYDDAYSVPAAESAIIEESNPITFPQES